MSGDGQAARKKYHHGNLREALLQGALDLIAEKDVGAVSLRAVARKVGVTNAAPYHHFKDKADLLTAVAIEGFRCLSENLEAVTANVSDPDERLTELGIGYIRTALGSPAHHQVMFRPDLHKPELHAVTATEVEAVCGNPEPITQAAQGAFGKLIYAVTALQQDCGANGDVMPQAILCWSTVHGFATLWVQGALSKKTGLTDWEPAARATCSAITAQVRQQFEQAAAGGS